MEYITRVRYFINNPDYIGMTNSDNWGIYIGLTEKNSFDSISDWLSVSSMSLVFDGIVTHPQDSGWWDIILQTPFYYDGSQNLAIAIHEKTPSGTPTHTYYLSYTDTVNVGLIFNSQGGGAINPNPISPPAGILKSNVPILQFYFEEECSSPANFKIDSLTATESHLSWTPMGSESLWNIRYKMTNSENWNIIENISTPFYSLVDLFSIQSYIVQIQANCGSESSEWVNPIYFTTPILPGMEYTVDWEIFKNKTAGDFSITESIEPDNIVKLESIDPPNYSTSMDRFYSRIRGYIIPRTSGLYSFHFGSDDIGQFWISTDEDETNSVLAINNDTIQTNLTLNQYSQNLIEGNRYFFEVLHYDSVFNDFIKLGWTMPGDTIIETLKNPFISSCATNVLPQNLSFLNTEIIGYPGSQHSIICRFTPWNVTNKTINWLSTDENIAIVDEFGVVTLVSEGSCQILGSMANDNAVTDTVNINVWNFQGPFFVKANADNNTNGQNWEDAIDLQTLLKILNTRIDNEIVTVYAAGGLYKPTETIDRNISFLINNVRFVGGFSELSTGTDTTLRDINLYETKLCGDIGALNESIDNSYHVVYIGGKSLGLSSSQQITDNSVLDGIVIQNGRASCSTHGRDFSVSWRQDDLGGGVFVKFAHLKLCNCTIKNCISWNSGAALYSQAGNGKKDSIFVSNCIVEYNQTLQELMTSGGIINVVVNVYGSGMAFTTTIAFVNNSIFRYNHAMAEASAIYMAGGATAYINESSFYSNTGGSNGDIYSTGSSSTINMNNVTNDGSVMTFRSNANISNSTITKGYYSWYPATGHRNIDNSIISEFVTNEPIGDTNINISYSLIQNTLYGTSIYDTISTSIPEYSFLLDSISDNGGQTPTMKLKNNIFNPAISYGNPLYLGTFDQRGALRQDSVSIGAYQWVNSTGIIGSHSALELCLGASYELYAEVLPEFVSVPEYYLTSTDSSIVNIEGSAIYALGEGDVNIIYNSLDGHHTDTCFVNVIGNVGVESINGPTEVCEGETSVIYTVNPIVNATSYLWTLPDGATGVSDTNSIELNFGVVSSSGNLTVKGINSCFDGDVSVLPITVKQITSNTLTETACDSYTAPDGQVYNTSGIKTAIILNSAGCDSVITIDLNINYTPVTPIITLQENILSSDSPNGNQWYDQNGLILGANEQDYLVTYDGDYFVIVTLLDCSSPSSNIINVTGTSAWVAGQNENVKVYPNPFKEELIIENGDNSVIVNFEILNSIGQIVCKGNLVEKIIIQTSDYEPGVYLLKLENGNYFEFKTIVKE